MSGLLSTFRTRAEDAGSSVHTASDPRDAARLVGSFVEESNLMLSPSVIETWPRFVEALNVSYEVADDDPAATTDSPVGVIHGELAVAETGSVLTVEDDLAHRLVSMLSLRLVQLVYLSDLVATLDAVADLLTARSSQPGYAALMTGPSKTADIERSLTIGVQGPAALDVVVVG